MLSPEDVLELLRWGTPGTPAQLPLLSVGIACVPGRIWEARDVFGA